MNIFQTPFSNNNNVNNNANVNIEDLQRKLQMMNQQQIQRTLNPNTSIGGSFGKLQDFVQKTDKNKVNYANNCESVINKYNEMRDVFVLFMLEHSRPQFENWCNQMGLTVIDDYVNEFINKTNEYVEPSIKQENEIDLLKKQIAELQAQILNSRGN